MELIEAYEQKLVKIVRRLPLERISQVIDFAQFLEFQMTAGDDLPDEDEEEIAVWETLLDTDKSQRLLEKMADEALTDIQAGHAGPVAYTEDGEIAPG